jgi:DNA (cytosine-5)-methyltransferase 1
MLGNQFLLPVHHELVVDLFAGGGGASTGIEQAIGRHVDVAVNHDREAISLHTANHPQTRHYCSDVFEVDPLTVTDGQPVGLLWASPDCKHFSKAKGGKPVSKKIRSLAWVVIKWAKAVQPRVICLENVEEFQTWGPLAADGRPCPQRKGETFAVWVGVLRGLGYAVEWRELRACDYGAPTIRKRLFLVARRDGQPITWPSPTHAQPDAKGKVPPGMKPWRTAADCIDWSIPAPSIFNRARPLADATCRRIAKGIVRYVYEAAQPFVAPFPAEAQHEPTRPCTLRHPSGPSLHPGQCNGEHVWNNDCRGIQGAAGMADRISAHAGAVAAQATDRAHIATLIQTGYGERPGQAPRVPGLDKPLGTVVSGQKHALVSAFLAKHYTGVVGSDMADPMGTVTTVDHHSLVTANIVKMRGDNVGSAAAEPLHTISAQGTHHALATANLVHMGHGEGKDGTKRFSHGVRDVAQPLNTVTASGATAGLVQAFLVKYYGTDQDPAMREPLHTVTTKDRFGLVTVRGQAYQIADIGLRMLTPRELYRAQGFPESYVIDRGAAGEPITKTAQVRMCGNSVCPPLARAIVAANYAEQHATQRRAA